MEKPRRSDKCLVLSQGFYRTKIMIVGVAGLPKEWLGRIITEKTIKELKQIEGIHILGEGGEYESLVLDCPLFKSALKVKGKKHWDGMAGWYEVKI